LEEMRAKGGDEEEIDRLARELDRQQRRSKIIPYIDPIDVRYRRFDRVPRPNTRSEEHTSELQSRSELVCRLLLEKKNDLSNQVSRSGKTTGRKRISVFLATRHFGRETFHMRCEVGSIVRVIMEASFLHLLMSKPR